MQTSQIRLRLRLISAVIIFISIILVATLYYIQVVKASVYEERADRQYTRGQNMFNRGDIFFTRKDGQLLTAATVKNGYVLAITPSLLKNKEDAYQKINAITPLDREQFLEKASRTDDPYEELAKRLTEEEAAAITALKLSGVTLTKMRWRYYPGNSLAAHALGFVSFKENALTGRYGLERYYNDILGRSGDSAYVNLFAEAFSTIHKSLKEKEFGGEGNIVLSLEPSVQAELEDKLLAVEKKFNSKGTGGIVMDPMTGEIIAMAMTPSFDLNNFSQEKTSTFGNPLVENVFEMGSIVKPLTMAAGLDSGVVTAASTYFDAGFLVLNTARISNFDGRGRGKADMQQVLNDSLNTGVVHVMQKMGKENFRNYMRDFGLGEETGIDLPGETHGLVDNLNSPRDIELATASYGQGIALTPIETVRALAALGNGGYLVTPHIVKRVDYGVGVSKDITFEPERQVLKKETSEEISRMLVNVVDKALLGGTVKMDHYTIAAKTGTALLAKKEGGGYYEDRFLHSFFGYFPAYQPKFLIFLFTIEPKGEAYASHTLTAPFMDLTKFLLNYYQIPPDR